MKAVIAALALAAVAQAAIPRAQPVGCDSWTMFGGVWLYVLLCVYTCAYVYLRESEVDKKKEIRTHAYTQTFRFDARYRF